jgi:hypothetical protein
MVNQSYITRPAMRVNGKPSVFVKNCVITCFLLAPV